MTNQKYGRERCGASSLGMTNPEIWTGTMRRVLARDDGRVGLGLTWTRAVGEHGAFLPQYIKSRTLRGGSTRAFALAQDDNLIGSKYGRSLVLARALGMVISILIVVTTLAIAGWGATGAQVPQPQTAQAQYTGPGSCSSTACHGSVQPRSDSRVWQNEYSIWVVQD